MQLSVPTIALIGLLVFPAAAAAPNAQITSVDPLTAKAGDAVSAKGQGLGATNVDELYLTSGAEDVKVEILEQSDQVIRFKVPTGLKSGRWTLMTHMKSSSGPRLIEQPVRLTVE